MAKANAQTGEIVASNWHDDDVSFRDAIASSFDEFGQDAVVVEASPFALIEKDKLIGQPFFIISTAEGKEDQYDNGGFIAVRLVTQNDEKFYFTDGSTGVRDQIRKLVEKYGRDGGFMIKNGLRKSEYTYTDPTSGKRTPATTFYLA